MDSPATQIKNRRATFLTLLVVSLCWLSILAEGYDLTVYGAVLHELLRDPEWALTPVMAGAIGSYVLVGMLIGNVIVGSLTDLIGRKNTLIASVTLFSVSMGLAAMAPSPEMFGLFRFIGGLGIGGVVPTATALTLEYSPPERRSLLNAIMFTGYPLGGVVGALLALHFLPEYGWRMMFWIGVLPLLLIPVMVKWLPESIIFLHSRKRFQEAEQVAKRFGFSVASFTSFEEKQEGPLESKWHSIRQLFHKSNIRATLLFWSAMFMGLLMIYGLNTWLPKLMQKAGYPLGSSLTFLLTLNLAAAFGVLIIGAASDHWGSKRVITGSFLLGGISISLLSVKSSLPVVYTLVALAGFGAISSSLILAPYITKYFPPDTRATALGFALGFARLGAVIGPIMGGLLLAWQVSQSWNFYFFAVPGIFAALAIALIPKNQSRQI
ncbi:MFS transporter [Brevibacillus sp. NRS-1366]|uniref:MFS transporter n=1 Tax=Brevibacillus sp. NRS-1366 TaxID=3233899 RepID=UPI003D1C83CB